MAMAAWTNVRALSRDVYVLAAVAFSVALGFGVVAPAIPLFSVQFGVGSTAAGAVVSAFALMRLAFGPFAGRLVDRLGERTTMIGGLAVVAVSSLFAGLAQSYPQLLVLRAVGGIGSTAFTVSTIALVIRVASPYARGRAMSTYQTGFVIGGIIGPAVGGAVLGLSMRAPFFLYAGTLGLGVAVALFFLARRDLPARRTGESAGGDAARPDGGSGEATMRVSEALRTPEYRAAIAANFATGFALFGIRAAIVPLLLAALHASKPWIGGAFFVGSLVQAALMLPAGRAVDAAGRRIALVGGAAVSAIGLLFLAGANATWMVVAAMGVLGAGGAFLGSAPGALVGDVVRGRSGTVLAIYQMCGDAGTVIGPIVAGLLVDHGSFGLAFGLGALMIAGAGLLGLGVPGPRPATRLPTEPAGAPTEPAGAPTEPAGAPTEPAERTDRAGSGGGVCEDSVS